MAEHWIIRVLKYIEKNPGNRLLDARNALGENVITTSRMDTLKGYVGYIKDSEALFLYHGEFDNGGANHHEKQLELSPYGLFQLIDYRELKEAQKSAKWAIVLSFIAITIALTSLLVPIHFAQNVNVVNLDELLEKGYVIPDKLEDPSVLMEIVDSEEQMSNISKDYPNLTLLGTEKVI